MPQSDSVGVPSATGGIVHDHRLLPPGYTMDALGSDDFAVEQPDSRRRVRATLSRDFYGSHFDHTDFWTPGSASFPLEGRPLADAA